MDRLLPPYTNQLADLLCGVVGLWVVFALSASGQLSREANTSLNLPADLPAGIFTTTDAFPGLSFADPVAIVAAPGESNRLFIVEQIGRIAVIPDLSNPARQTFLDIQGIVRDDGNEEGLLGLAFHPNYNNAGQVGHGQFYVFFQTTISNQRHWRLSRFSVSSGNPNVADSGSEQALITQLDQAGNHNGGDLHFGDDGYLYVSVGDEGSANDSFDNSQFINKDFFGCILRIDVDSQEANLAPNTHSAVHAGTYKVPADNPFVGASSFNGIAVTPSTVRTEIWAIGLRNPWRMSFDRPTGRLFVADVGQGTREEINILSPAVFATNGGVPNYGWSWREGFLPFSNNPGDPTPPAGFSDIDPIHDYPRSLGRSVTGGLVYRGANYPELTGDYLFADYATGRIWSMDDPGGPGQTVVQIATDSQIAGFGINPLNGDILLADDNSNRAEDDQIKRLVRTASSGTQPPQFLSETGAFSDLALLTPEAGIVPYDIRVSFWSDDAEKSRWFSIPDVGDDMDFAADGNWSFPEGQIWIKHFDLDMDRDNPGTNLRRIETRFIVKTTDDVYGLTYRWNNIGGGAQTDAELVAEGGLTEDFTITEGGQQVTQTWKYPSRNDCRACHTEVGGFALGFNTRQLNEDFQHGSVTENQIAAFESAGYFANDPPDPSGLAKFFAAGDQTASLRDRARSYLAVNCVQCHQPGGAVQGYWDARPEVPFANAGVVEGPLVNNGGDPFSRVIVPGSPDHSMILQRLLAVEGSFSLPAMPPLGTCEANQEAIDLMTAWIQSQKKILFIRGGDRTGGFLEGTNDAQRTEHLADINNTTTGGGNHGWGELASTLRGEGFIVEQIIEGSETASGPADGIHIDLETLNLEQYCAIVFGSNNAVYDTAAIDALDVWIRGGGSALFISDANFGGDWADAANSDQQFLDRFGLIMNQDNGTYAITRSEGEFMDPNHPIFETVDEFHGEGVSPISIGTLPGDVTATVLANAEGSVRRNVAPFSGQNRGATTAVVPAVDGALLVANAGLGKVAGHYDRNTFFNQGGVGSDITRFDNRQYAINLFTWLCGDPVPPAPPDPPSGLSASDGTSETEVSLQWNSVADATGYLVFRNAINESASAIQIAAASTNLFDDSSAVPGFHYYYWVKAVNGAVESAFSASDAGVRALSIPASVAASDGIFEDRVRVSWAPVTGATQYEVYRQTGSLIFVSIGQTAGAETFFDDTGTAASVRRWYRVRALFGGFESDESLPDSGYRGITAPGGVASNPGFFDDKVRVTWGLVPGAGRYVVYRNATAGEAGAVEVGQTGAGVSAFNDGSAVPGTSYFYSIRAEGSGFEGAFSPWVEGLRSSVTTFRPDKQIGKTASVKRGDGIYNRSGAQQSLQVKTRKRKALRFFLTVENDGASPDTLSLSGTRGNRVFRATYFEKPAAGGSVNVTAAMIRGGHRAGLKPGAGAEMELKVKRKGPRTGRTKKKNFRVTGRSGFAPERQDTVSGKAASR